jgi:hypothetical protein
LTVGCCLLVGLLPFFVVGVVDGVGIAVDASSDTAPGAAKAAVFFLFFFVLAAAEITREGRGHNDDLNPFFVV